MKQKKAEEERTRKEMANKPYVQVRSAKLTDKLENEKLAAIFQSLDSDHDGVISAAKISIQELSIQLLDVFTPILQDMEKRELTMNVEQFLEAAHQRYRGLTVYDKQAILDFKKRSRAKEGIITPTFKARLLLLT